MRTVLQMVRKDLLRRRRAPAGMLIMLAFPLLFAGMLALAFGEGDGGPPKVRLLLENRDDGALANLLAGAFASDQAAEIFEVRQVGEEGRAMMEDGEASALLVIPEGFTEKVIEGEPAQLELVRNPAEGILPEIAEQTMAIAAEAISEGSRLLRDPLDELSGLIETTESETEITVTESSVVDIARLTYQVIDRTEQYLFPPVITLTVASQDESEDDALAPQGMDTIFLFILPGVSVFALFLVGDVAMRDIITEAKAGTLRRLMSGPAGAGAVVASKAITTAVVSAISLAILAAIAWTIAPRGISFVGFAILSAGLISCVTGAAAIIYGMSSNERQGATVGSLVFLGLGFASGSLVPLDNLPSVIQTIAPWTPFYWATEGFKNLIFEGSGMADVIVGAAGLTVLGLVLLSIGAAALNRQVARGAAS